MGFRFRKSIKIGPFRLNFSGSGIGYSFGRKGARVTKMPNRRTRTTISIPGTGVSYVTECGGKKGNRKGTVGGYPRKHKGGKSSIIFLQLWRFCYLEKIDKKRAKRRLAFGPDEVA